MSGKRNSIAILVLASLSALACLLLGGRMASVVFGIVTMAFPPALIALAVARNGRVGSLRIPVLVFALVLQICVVAMLALSGRHDPDGWWLGLPPATAVMLYGLWLSPLLIVSVIHAWHFAREGLTDEDLRTVRDIARRMRKERGED